MDARAAFELLARLGAPPRLVQHARLVALADKLWKGVRVAALEERVINALALRAGHSRWDLFVPLDDAFERIAAEGADRLERSTH